GSGRREDSRQIDQDGFVLARREPETGSYGSESSACVRDMQGLTGRRCLAALPERDIDRAVGWMNPALRDEPQLACAWRRLGKLEVDEVLTSDPLVTASPGEVEVPIVARAHDVAYVLSAIVANSQELLQRRGRDRPETRRWDGE